MKTGSRLIIPEPVISKSVFGKNTMVYQPFFYRQFKQHGVTSKLTFSDYTNRIGIGSLNHAEVMLDERPVLKALVSDIEELYRLGKEFQYEDISEGYTSACHLCLDIRKRLVQQSNNFTELTPARMYAQF